MRPAGPLDFLAVDAAIDRYRASLGEVELQYFDSWRSSFWARYGSKPSTAFIQNGAVALLDGSRGHRVVVFADADALLPTVAALQADPHVGAISLPGHFEPLFGFRRVSRWEHEVDLPLSRRSAFPSHGRVQVIEWSAQYRDDAARLMAAVNCGSVDGLFVVWPELPSFEACKNFLDRLDAGDFGDFYHRASLLAFDGSRLIGLILVAILAPQKPLLIEIALRFRYRGTGLAANLVDRVKVVLALAGFETLYFLTCGKNAAVLALFQTEDARSRQTDSGWIWLRG